MSALEFAILKQRVLALEQRVEGEARAGEGATRLVPLGRAPARPRVGTLAFADGVGWNPGGGRGLYIYGGTSWVRVVAVP